MEKLKKQILGYYQDVMESEGMHVIPLVFCKVGRGGACVQFDRSNRPIQVEIDTKRCHDHEYAILHEIAHIKVLNNGGSPGHHKKFRDTEADLVDRYMYSKLTFKYFAK